MITFDQVSAAADILSGVAHKTPVMTSRTLNAMAGCEVVLKCENLQRVGAFKFRGAYNALSRLSESQRKAGVLAYSSGNHAQAVALAARLMDMRATIVMPANAPTVKLEATRGYGAEVVTYDPATQVREQVAQELASARGLAMIPPFDHPDVIAGQGTAALELMQQVEGLDVILAPCGGGGLLSGTAIAVKHVLPKSRVIGVEPAGADNGGRAFSSGKIEVVEHPDTFADGLRPKALGDHTFAVISKLVDQMVTVSEDDFRQALEFLWSRMKLVVEPSGAVALAPVLLRHLGLEGKRVGVILSGGNADIGAVADWLRSSKP